MAAICADVHEALYTLHGAETEVSAWRRGARRGPVHAFDQNGVTKALFSSH